MAATRMWDPIGECVARARAVPSLLEALRGAPDAAERAVSVCDDLLADLDVLLTRCTRLMRAGEDVEDVADQTVRLKWMVYCVLRHFLAGSGWSDSALAAYEHSAKCDLRDSRRRVDAVRPDVAPTVRFRRESGTRAAFAVGGGA